MLRNLELVGVLVVACLGLLRGSLAFAQEVRQDPRVVEAKTACAAGDAQKGVRLLAELYAATNEPIWIFNQGRCYHQNNLLPQAQARFKEFLRKSSNGPAEDVRDAENFIKEIEAEIHKNDPSVAGGTAATGSVTTVSTSATEPTVDESKGRGLRYAGVGCGIFGGAAIVTGVVFSLLTNKANNDVESKTKDNTVPASSVHSDISNGPLYQNLQWVSYGVGAAAVITGAVLYYVGATQSTSSTTTAQLSPVLLNGGAGATMHISF